VDGIWIGGLIEVVVEDSQQVVSLLVDGTTNVMAQRSRHFTIH
jgi:hypothetical protein